MTIVIHQQKSKTKMETEAATETPALLGSGIEEVGGFSLDLISREWKIKKMLKL